MAPEPDFAVQLNNYLQGHPSGNLTPYFQYVMTAETGPDLQMAHHATVKFRGTVIGRGRGFSKGAAKRDAARVALQYVHKHGLPEPIKSDNSDGSCPRPPELPLQSPWRQPNALVAVAPAANQSRLPQQPPQNGLMYVFLVESIFGYLRCSGVAIVGSEISHGVGFSVDHVKQIVHTQTQEYLYATPNHLSLRHPQEGSIYKPD